MKNLLKITIISLSTIFLQSCYTQLASTQVMQVETHPNNYTYKETRISQSTDLDSANISTTDSIVIVKEYYYWAYEPFIEMDPYYDLTINYYPRPYRWNRYYYDPFWSYNYYDWCYYEPYSWDYRWNYHYYGYNYSHWNNRRYHNYYNNWNWYANDDDPPRKKRDWDRRGTNRDNAPIVRNGSPEYVVSGITPATNQTVTVYSGQNNSRNVKRSVKLEQKDITTPAREVVRDSGKQKTSHDTKNRKPQSISNNELIQLIAAKISKIDKSNNGKSVTRDRNTKHKAEKSNRSKSSNRSSKSSKSGSVSSNRKSSSSKASKSSKSNSNRSRSSNKKSKSSSRSR